MSAVDNKAPVEAATPWAADSLIECSTHEYDSGISVGAMASAASELANSSSAILALVLWPVGVV